VVPSTIERRHKNDDIYMCYDRSVRDRLRLLNLINEQEYTFIGKGLSLPPHKGPTYLTHAAHGILIQIASLTPLAV
jgi:hypothetical protein